MTEELAPRRMGVTHKVGDLPSEKKQEDMLDEAGVWPIFSWAEFMGHTIQGSKNPPGHETFMATDTAVIVDQRVLGKKKWHFNIEVLGDAQPSKGGGKRGPKTDLYTATPDQWTAIKLCYLKTKPKIENALMMAEAFGIKTNYRAIRHRANVEVKAAIQAAAKDEGKK